MAVLTTNKRTKSPKFVGGDTAPDNLRTVTLSYNGNNSIAKAIMNLIETSGVFDVLQDDEPNETTIAAIKELEEDRGHTAKDIDDLLRQLKS